MEEASFFILLSEVRLCEHVSWFERCEDVDVLRALSVKLCIDFLCCGNSNGTGEIQLAMYTRADDDLTLTWRLLPAEYCKSTMLTVDTLMTEPYWGKC